jgi:hypothetical protein
MKRTRKALLAFATVPTLFIGASGAMAQSQGTCLAVVNNLTVPVLFTVDSTDGSSTNMAMTAFDMQVAGHQFTPWVIQPGGPQTLVFKQPGSGYTYLISSNGNFGGSALAIEAPVSPQWSVAPNPLGHMIKSAWAFHSEMTENGSCKGTWVATLD